MYWRLSSGALGSLRFSLGLFPFWGRVDRRLPARRRCRSERTQRMQKMRAGTPASSRDAATHGRIHARGLPRMAAFAAITRLSHDAARSAQNKTRIQMPSWTGLTRPSTHTAQAVALGGRATLPQRMRAGSPRSTDPDLTPNDAPAASGTCARTLRAPAGPAAPAICPVPPAPPERRGQGLPAHPA